MNFDENFINLNSDNPFPFLDYNDYGLESNYHINSFIQNYTQNLDEFLAFSNINIEKIKNEDRIDNLSSIRYIEDLSNSENNYSINNYIKNYQPFFLFNNDDHNNFSNNIIDEVSIIIKKERKKRKRFYKHREVKNSKKNIYILIRKDNINNIRNKNMCKYFKILKNKINIILESTGVIKKYRFHFLPKKFIFKFISILLKTKYKANKDSLEEIFSKQFCEKYGNKNLNEHLFVFKYLETNKNVGEMPIFNIIKKMIFSQLFNEFLNQKNFKCKFRF